MDMVERVARALAAASEERWDAKTFSETLSGNDPDEMRSSYFFLARAAIAAMSEELLAHFQGALDSPALGTVEKYRVSVCMDDIRHIMGAEVE